MLIKCKETTPWLIWMTQIDHNHLHGKKRLNGIVLPVHLKTGHALNQENRLRCISTVFSQLVHTSKQNTNL